ncbi:sulfotransferase family protein [Paenibacillus shunpengii]|uniref:Sulfotransferase family protein n=1 Tax=Paenibacillus shunpengii TaxID=2054424 RepID=A0ABW5SKQ7_9BACL
MKHFRDDQLVFLLCTPRSGSSLTTVMLQNHEEVFAAQEMWYLLSLADLQLAPVRPYGGTGIIRQFYNGIISEDLFHRAARSFGVEIYEGLLNQNGARKIIDKSPRYYILLEFLDAVFPESQRIGLFRNPLSVAASYKKVNAFSGEPFSLIEDLKQPIPGMKIVDLTAGLFRYATYFKGESAYSYKLKYEELVRQPEQQLRKLCEFIGISYREGMEKYGNPVSEEKADLFYSMGAGDPFLLNHTQAHVQSIDAWKDQLSPDEVDAYCRVLGAQIFHDLGYSEELEEAQRITGVRYELSPDEATMERIEQQFLKSSGYIWKPDYELSTSSILTGIQPAEAVDDLELEAMQGNRISDHRQASIQIAQLETRVRLLENRLTKSYMEKNHVEKQLIQLRSKLNRIKSILPFGNRLSSWAQGYLSGREGKS